MFSWKKYQAQLASSSIVISFSIVCACVESPAFTDSGQMESQCWRGEINISCQPKHDVISNWQFFLSYWSFACNLCFLILSFYRFWHVVCYSCFFVSYAFPMLFFFQFVCFLKNCLFVFQRERKMECSWVSEEVMRIWEELGEYNTSFCFPGFSTASDFSIASCTMYYSCSHSESQACV